MTAAVRPITESTPYSRIRSVPTANAALPLSGRMSTSGASSGGMPSNRKTGAKTGVSSSKKTASPQHCHRCQHQNQRWDKREHQPQPVLRACQHPVIHVLFFCNPCCASQQQKRGQQQFSQVFQHRLNPFAARIPAPTEQADASQTAGKISNACTAPSCARTAATVDGISCRDAVFITTSRHISSDAPLPPASVCMRCAARMPSGVAAFPSPSRFALRLPHRFQKPSESVAHTGNSRCSTGRSAAHSFFCQSRALHRL